MAAKVTGDLDVKQAAMVNSISYGVLPITTANATTTLSKASPSAVVLSGSISGQKVSLGDATNRKVGWHYYVSNTASVPVTIIANDGTTLTTLNAGYSAYILLTSVATANGTWYIRVHYPVASQVAFTPGVNGLTSTNVQAAIEESVGKALTSEITATADTQTLSGTDSVLNSMTVTPASGTYFVTFSASMTSDAVGAAISASLYVNGVQKADSLRKIVPVDGGALSAGSARGIMHTQGLCTVNGSQAIDVRWSVSNGTATCHPRSLILIKVA